MHPNLDCIKVTVKSQNFARKLKDPAVRPITAPVQFEVIENQILLKQPIVRNGKQATVGYQPDVNRLSIL